MWKMDRNKVVYLCKYTKPIDFQMFSLTSTCSSTIIKAQSSFENIRSVQSRGETVCKCRFPPCGYGRGRFCAENNRRGNVHSTVYLKSRGRMPIRSLPPLGIRDIQQDIPPGWCLACRREVYSDRPLCPRCEGVMTDESEAGISLPGLYPGGGTDKM